MFKKHYTNKLLSIIVFFAITGVLCNTSSIKAYINDITAQYSNYENITTSYLNKTVMYAGSPQNTDITPTYSFPAPTPEATPSPEPTQIPSVLDGTISNASTASMTTNSVTIQWECTDEADGYILSINDGNSIYSVDTTNAYYTVNNMGSAKIFAYQISYYKYFSGLRVYSNTSNIFAACSLPDKVSNFKIKSKKTSGLHNASISLSWKKMNDALYYVYYKKENEDNYSRKKTSSNNIKLSKLDASSNYSIYVKAYCITPKNIGEASKEISTATYPTDVKGLSLDKETRTRIDISWKKNKTCDTYYIYRNFNDTGYELFDKTTDTSYSDTQLEAGTVYSYKIRPYNTNTKLAGTYSKKLRCVTHPNITKKLRATRNKSNSISLAWKENPSATGYLIYRRKAKGSFVYLTSTTDTRYTDTNLNSSRVYSYKILSYAHTMKNTSTVGSLGDLDYKNGFSNTAATSTLPSEVKFKIKAGFKRVRLTWSKPKRIDGYYIYKKINGRYVKIDTINNPNTLSIKYCNLKPNEKYLYKIYAYKIALDKIYVSSSSSKVSAIPKRTKKTTTKPSYYSTKKQLINSSAWKNTKIVKKYAVYKKCYTIPGIRSTNVGGFESKRMCPQGLTFSKKYMMISAYDSHYEENSVIYVMAKKSRKLLTVIVLPNKTHAGGICFDGKNVWVTNGKNLCTVDYKEIKKAAASKCLYKNVEYSGTYKTPHKVSFLNYYKGKIWTGNFMYTSKGTLRSYAIKKTKNNINLVQTSKVTIPCAVQGVTISSKGYLILSRAFGHINELNIYKPKKIGKSNMKLGKRIKTVKMPALNEEIAISGKYLYVNFESALPNSQALNHMDRVLAIKLKAVLKTEKKASHSKKAKKHHKKK